MGPEHLRKRRKGKCIGGRDIRSTKSSAALCHIKGRVGLKASMIRWAPHSSSRPVEEKDAAGDLPLRRRSWGKSVKTEWHCTHMVKEPGGADTRRRSAACT